VRATGPRATDRGTFVSLTTQYSVLSTLVSEYALLSGLILAGLALRLVALDRESFWLDEAGRAAIADLPLLAIPAAVGVVELSPPLYHFVLHGWTRLLDSGDGAIRLLSVLLGTAAIPLTYVLARELVCRRAALLAALFATVSPFYVAYAREAAMYTLLLVLALLCTLGFVRWLGPVLAGPAPTGAPSAPSGRAAAASHPRGALALYGMAALLALYTHYYALFLLAAQNAVVGWLAWRRVLDPRALRAWVLVQCLLALALVPWLPILWRQAGLAASVGDWAAPDPLTALDALAVAFSAGPLANFPTPLLVLVFGPALWAGVLALGNRPRLLGLLAAYLLVPIVCGLLLAVPLHAFRDRGFIAVAFVLQLLAAVGLLALADGRLAPFGRAGAAPPIPGRADGARARPPAALVAIHGGIAAAYGAVLVAVLLYGAAAHVADPRENWRAAAAFIAARAAEGDVLYVAHYGSQLALDRYLPPGLPRRGLPTDFNWNQGYTARYWLEPHDLEARVAPDLPAWQRAWVVLSHADGRGDRLLLDYFDRHYAAQAAADFPGIRVRLWHLQPGS
jgi:hypothetical protein